MKKINLLFLVVLLLGILAGCQTVTGRTAGETVDDGTITSEINIRIIRDSEMKFLQIGVETFAGHVSLTGSVPTKEAENRLIELAKGIRGVKDVKSNLIIRK
jgi:hyperosmotically inducible protein